MADRVLGNCRRGSQVKDLFYNIAVLFVIINSAGNVNCSYSKVTK